MDSPRQNRANKIGRKGVAILNNIIEVEMDWNFRINHLEDDFGIDAYIDIVTKDGGLTGKSIAMQIKSGESYFKHKTDYGWKFYGEFKHLNYYLNHDIPVILVLIDINLKKAFWTLCDASQTDRTYNGWSIVIPYNQELGIESKSELEKHISPTVDYVSQLEEYWKINKELKSFGRILFIAGKEDIHTGNYQPIIDALQRIKRNRDLLYHHKENIEIAIHGYDDDPRELYEIDEVRKWVINVLENIEGLSFFLQKGNYAQFLKLILFCQINFQVVEGSEYFDRGLLRREVEYESKDMVEVMNPLFYDLNKFCQENNVSISINEEISTNIVDCFTNGEFSREKNNKA
jgi:hypothetical protein